jgi:hypothetical protein
LGGRRVERVAGLRGCAVAIESSRISKSASSLADMLGVDFTAQEPTDVYETKIETLDVLRKS